MTETIEQEQTGNGTYTIQQGKADEGGSHLTFEIKTARKGGLAGKRIVSLMEGSDNSEFTGFGFLEDGENGKGVKPWRNFRITKLNPVSGLPLTQSQLVNSVGLILEHGNRGAINAEKICIEFEKFGRWFTLWIETKCMVCNRKLTTPESVARGIGPECWAKG